MTKAILTFAGMAGGLASVGLYYYCRSKIHETEMDSFKYLYKESQDCYKEAGKKYQGMVSKYFAKLDQLNGKNKVPTTELFIGWDHPKWLVTEKECRSTGGIAVDSKVSDLSNLKGDLANDLIKEKIVQGGKVLRLDIDIGKDKGALYNVAWWFLYKKYMSLYKNRMVEIEEPFVPVAEAREKNKTYLFLPLPEQIKNYKFVGDNKPLLNYTGKSYLTRFQEKVTEFKKKSPNQNQKAQAPKAPESPVVKQEVKTSEVKSEMVKPQVSQSTSIKPK